MRTPFGLLLTRMMGLGDIRAIGSGNIGATNVLRTGNKRLAAATLLLDMGKGAAVRTAIKMAQSELVAIQDELGDVPLVGFFCNGEISHNRVYSYTGVLSVFL